MKKRSLILSGCFLIMATAGCQPAVSDNEPSPSVYRFFGFAPREAKGGVISVQEGPDLDLIEQNDYFGYTPEEIAERFHHTITLNYDFRGFDPQSVQAPPPPGVHPREGMVLPPCQIATITHSAILKFTKYKMMAYSLPVASRMPPVEST